MSGKGGEPTMIYAIEELKQKIAPIARNYHIPAIYLFGSYARGEAVDSSDVDILIDRENSSIKSLFDLGAFYNDINEALGKSVDVVTTDSLYQSDAQRRAPYFAGRLEREKVTIYER
jgi:predicted nucleotidyltransferase